MRILVVGTGGVGSAFASIARRRSFFDHCAFADYDLRRSEAVVAAAEDDRFTAHRVDASRRDGMLALIRETRPDAVLNAVDPLFNVPIFDACLGAGVTYLDMAMTLSEPHPERPFELTGVKLGDYQFERSGPGRRRASSPSSGSASSRARPTSSHVTPPTSCSPRSTRSGSATARASSSRATTSRRRSRSGRRSRSASTRR
jgi:hypothetical protein